MTGLGVVWIVPGGGVLVTVVLKIFHKSRPSAFRGDSGDKKKTEI